ncbi:hypothetical protein L1887_07390 [Cichorium endivia]|nr:hypothetical protein L1887_07390 [Cichorium endivia]
MEFLKLIPLHAHLLHRARAHRPPEFPWCHRCILLEVDDATVFVNCAFSSIQPAAVLPAAVNLSANWVNHELVWCVLFAATCSCPTLPVVDFASIFMLIAS